MSVTINEMMSEVRVWTFRKGWRGPDAPDRTIGEECALLHSEVSEALEALRVNGLDRWSVWDDGMGLVGATSQKLKDGSFDYKDKKPEGVASEIADTFIRLLDNYAERNIKPFELGTEDESLGRDDAYDLLGHEIFDSMDTMPPGDLLSILHLSISAIYLSTNEFAMVVNCKQSYDATLWTIMRVSTCLGIDLFAEYEAKMKYNETREHRHGGKSL